MLAITLAAAAIGELTIGNCASNAAAYFFGADPARLAAADGLGFTFLMVDCGNVGIENCLIEITST